MNARLVKNVAGLMLSCALTMAVTACAPNASEYTVDYYKAHEKERKAKIAECSNDPGALRNDPLCVNAREAERSDAFGSLKDLPPVGLLEAQKRREKEEATRKDAQEQRPGG